MNYKYPTVNKRNKLEVLLKENYKFISSTLSKYSLIFGITKANVPSSNGFFKLADFISSKNGLLPPSLHKFK